MHYPLTMQKAERVGDLTDPWKRIIRAQRSASAKVLIEPLAVEQLHCQAWDGALPFRVVSALYAMLDEVKNTADALVGNISSDPYFAFEAFASFRVTRKVSANSLERDMQAKLLVENLVDFTHTAACDEANDAEPVCDAVTL